MNKLIILLFSMIVLFSCANENKNGARVTFSTPVSLKSNYLFTTCGGKMLIMVDLKGGQKMNELMIKEKSFSLYDLGIGNAFSIDSNGTYYLYTARHCAVGLEKVTRTIGNDIAIVNYNVLGSISPTTLKLTCGYIIDSTVNDLDSVFIRGYLPDIKGKIQFVEIAGIGKKMKSSNSIILDGKNKEYLQENTLNILLKENVDLAGLSGAPAFNKRGKVIGIYSGRTMRQDNNDYYARVSLFK